MSTLLQDEFQIPVSIADLPAHDFQVSPETLTEQVVAELENSPELPGVLIVENSNLVGFLTRLKLFERLGHRYGIELFMRKPIRELNSIMRTQVEPLPGNLRVDEAVQRALKRPPLDIYDPVVIELKNKMFRILDMNVLVLAQSRTVTNLSNIVGKLQQIDSLIYQDWEKTEILERMLRLLGQVVPYHQAHILVQDGQRLELAASHGALDNAGGDWRNVQSNSIYKMMLKHRQVIYLPDTSHVPAWQGMEVLGKPASWLGVPLLEGEENFLGFLSLGRNVDSPFIMDEKQTCQAFAQRIVKTLLRKGRKNGPVLRDDLFKQWGDDFMMNLEMFALTDSDGI